VLLLNAAEVVALLGAQLLPDLVQDGVVEGDLELRQTLSLRVANEEHPLCQLARGGVVQDLLHHSRLVDRVGLKAEALLHARCCPSAVVVPLGPLYVHHSSTGAIRCRVGKVGALVSARGGAHVGKDLETAHAVGPPAITVLVEVVGRNNLNRKAVDVKAADG